MENRSNHSSMASHSWAVIRWALALILVLFAGGGRSFANTIYFYVDCPDPNHSPVGHVFVQLVPMAGPQQGLPLYYGHYAATKNILTDGGRIKNDMTHHWNYRIGYPVTNAQYNAAVGVIRRDIANPPAYNLVGFNCVAWAQTVATAAGLTLPPSVNAFGICDPRDFCLSLMMIGNGGMFMGGTVDANPNPDEDEELPPDPVPTDFGFTGVAVGAHVDPVTLAALMGLDQASQDLGIFDVNTADPFQVILTNTDTNSAVISITWGDGSGYQTQSLAFSHHYAAPGCYTVTLAVVDSESVLVYYMSVIVADDVMTESVAITVPTPIPNTNPNSGFDDVTPPEPL